ncbi:MAG: hypothetical protein NTY74_14825 [Ignavibacteriae bacterium]|nr:hypothetical protein [Ignavibacteriota bacterium]
MDNKKSEELFFIMFMIAAGILLIFFVDFLFTNFFSNFIQLLLWALGMLLFAVAAIIDKQSKKKGLKDLADENSDTEDDEETDDEETDDEETDDEETDDEETDDEETDDEDTDDEETEDEETGKSNISFWGIKHRHFELCKSP